MESILLTDMVVIFSLSIAVLLACHAIRLPTIVGFIITGILSGPHGLGLVRDLHDVENLANIGIVLLLFSIGMEFSIKKILEIKRYFFIGGTFQVTLTALAGFLIALFLGRPIPESIFLGFILSLSSTAIVLRIFDAKSEMDSPQGKVTLSILIFQDFIAIPMMLFIPFLSDNPEYTFDLSIIYLLFKGIVLLLVVFISAQSLVPKLMFQITKTKNRELFLLTILTICFSVALLAENVGLSLSLGAFLAGLIVSETEYKHQAISDILPFKDIFTSVFFISIGMLLDLGFVLERPLLIVLMTIGLISLKAFIATSATLLLGMPLRTAVLVGLAVCQIGEFSLILAKTGFSYGIGSSYYYQLFLSISLFTMALTPTLIRFSPYFAYLVGKLPLPKIILFGYKFEPEAHDQLKKDHLIIIGFGVAGRSLAKSAKDVNIPYVIFEMNAETVKRERAREPIHFGDASHELLLLSANIKDAKMIAIVINDSSATLRIVKAAKKLNPDIYVIARAHYMREMKSMINAGVDELVTDEISSTIEVFSKVLKKYEIKNEMVEQIISNRLHELTT